MSSGFEGFGFVRVAAFGQILMVFLLGVGGFGDFTALDPNRVKYPSRPNPTL